MKMYCLTALYSKFISDLNYIYFGCYNDYIEKRLGFRYTRTDWEDNIPPFVCMTNCQLMHRSNFFGITVSIHDRFNQSWLKILSQNEII